MLEQEIKSFIKIVTQYFESITGVKAELGLPYVKSEDDNLKDYTGIIGVSGVRKGGVYFTADRALLKEFAACILDEEEVEEEYIYDLVGEMVNTIAGNIREVFGTNFLISVPIIVQGKIETISMRLKPPIFIIPIRWKSHQSHLAIGLE